MELLHNIFITNTRNPYVQFLRYGCVAAAALVVDFGTLVILKEYAHFHYLAAASASFILGLITNYWFSKLWVFHDSKLKNERKEFVVFFIIGVVGLLLTNLLMWVGTDIMDFYYMTSKIIVTVLVYFWNFGARKKILFN